MSLHASARWLCCGESGAGCVWASRRCANDCSELVKLIGAALIDPTDGNELTR